VVSRRGELLLLFPNDDDDADEGVANDSRSVVILRPEAPVNDALPPANCCCCCSRRLLLVPGAPSNVHEEQCLVDSIKPATTSRRAVQDNPAPFDVSLLLSAPDVRLRRIVVLLVGFILARRSMTKEEAAISY